MDKHLDSAPLITECGWHVQDQLIEDADGRPAKRRRVEASTTSAAVSHHEERSSCLPDQVMLLCLLFINTGSTQQNAACEGCTFMV